MPRPQVALTCLYARVRARAVAACLDIFDDTEAVRSECDWNEMLEEVLVNIALETPREE